MHALPGVTDVRLWDLSDPHALKALQNQNPVVHRRKGTEQSIVEGPHHTRRQAWFNREGKHGAIVANSWPWYNDALNLTRSRSWSQVVTILER